METLCEAPKSGSGSGVTPEGPTPPAIETVEEQVETVRGLKYTSHVAVTPLTQEQIDRRLTKNFDKTYPVDFYARRSEAWATIGVIPAGASIRDALLAFQTGQVVGYYNPANGQLVYIGDTDLDQTERFILAHELTHALDDQHFGLKRLDSVGARCDDEAFMAGLGAIEGSAQYFATQVLMRFPSDAPVGGGGDDGSLDAVPPFITALQLWPYTAGMAFIQHLDGVGGTTEVDEALTTFPASTEQILHPERWPNDVPQPVDVPDLGPALGAGWQRPGRDDGRRGLAADHAGAPAGRRRRRTGGDRLGRRALSGVDRRCAHGGRAPHGVGLGRGRAGVRRCDAGVDGDATFVSLDGVARRRRVRERRGDAGRAHTGARRTVISHHAAPVSMHRDSITSIGSPK